MQASSIANFRVNKTGGVRTSDLITNLGTVSYSGALVITNSGSGALAVNDTFTLFNASSESGNFSSIVGPPGVTFAFAPSTGVLTVSSVSTISTVPTNITVSVSGANVNLSWPANHLGWTLQTNSINISVDGDWFAYPGSTGVTSETIPLPKTGYVFFRLYYP
jgi:hypothetical protein